MARSKFTMVQDADNLWVDLPVDENTGKVKCGKFTHTITVDGPVPAVVKWDPLLLNDETTKSIDFEVVAKDPLEAGLYKIAVRRVNAFGYPMTSFAFPLEIKRPPVAAAGDTCMKFIRTEAITREYVFNLPAKSTTGKPLEELSDQSVRVDKIQSNCTEAIDL